MTIYEIMSIIVASIGTVIALLSFIFSLVTKKRCDSVVDSQMSIKTNKGTAVGINNGEINVKK